MFRGKVPPDKEVTYGWKDSYIFMTHETTALYLSHFVGHSFTRRVFRAADTGSSQTPSKWAFPNILCTHPRIIWWVTADGENFSFASVASPKFALECKCLAGYLIQDITSTRIDVGTRAFWDPPSSKTDYTLMFKPAVHQAHKRKKRKLHNTLKKEREVAASHRNS